MLSIRVTWRTPALGGPARAVTAASGNMTSSLVTFRNSQNWIERFTAIADPAPVSCICWACASIHDTPPYICPSIASEFTDAGTIEKDSWFMMKFFSNGVQSGSSRKTHPETNPRICHIGWKSCRDPMCFWGIVLLIQSSFWWSHLCLKYITSQIYPINSN